MPQLFNRAALAIIINSMKGSSNTRLGYLEKKMTAFEQAVSVTLEYSSDPFDIIPEVENAVIDIIDKIHDTKPNIQFHIAQSPSVVTADKAFTDFILNTIFSQLFLSIQQGILITLHITKTDEACIIEIQESLHSKTNISTFDNSMVNTDQPLVVCKQLMEDMGGEMAYGLHNNGKYYRLKFKLG